MRVCFSLSLLGFLAVAACGENTPPTNGMDASVDDAAVGDGAPDAPMECARDEMGRCMVVEWSNGPSVPTPIDHHTTFVHEHEDGAYVYVAGGFYVIDEETQSLSDQLMRAPIHDDGTLGEWSNVLTLPAALGFHGQAETHDRVYLMAGTTIVDGEPGLVDDVRIVEMTESTGVRVRRGRSLGVARVHATGHVLGNRLYLVGGSSEGGIYQQTTLVSDLDENGTNGAWREAAVLPAPRTHHSGLVHDGHIYLIGGLTTGSRAENEVWRSVNTRDGEVTGWEVVGDMDEAPWTASAFEYNNYVYIVGGGHELSLPGVSFVDRVRRAPFLLDGSVGAFEDVAAPLPIARSHCHQTPVYNGHIYSVGGRRDINAPTSINNVFVGTINEVMVDVDAGVVDAGADSGPEVDAGPLLSPAEAALSADADHASIFAVLCECAPDALGFMDESECMGLATPFPPETLACRDAGHAVASEAVAELRRCIADAAATARECFESVAVCSTAALSDCIDVLNVSEEYCTVAESELDSYNEARLACAQTSIVGDALDTCVESSEGSSATGTAVFAGNTLLSGDHRDGSCAALPGAPDLSYKWVAPSTGTFSIKMIPETRFAAALYVLDAGCAGAELGCDYSGSRFPIAPSVEVPATAGHVYYIVVDGLSPADFGSFHIDITPP